MMGLHAHCEQRVDVKEGAREGRTSKAIFPVDSGQVLCGKCLIFPPFQQLRAGREWFAEPAGNRSGKAVVGQSKQSRWPDKNGKTGLLLMTTQTHTHTQTIGDPRGMVFLLAINLLPTTNRGDPAGSRAVNSLHNRSAPPIWVLMGVCRLAAVLVVCGGNLPRLNKIALFCATA